MSAASQEFTLGTDERQRVLDAVLQNVEDITDKNIEIPLDASLVAPSTPQPDTFGSDDSGRPAFEITYSQSQLTQTQQDTSSFQERIVIVPIVDKEAFIQDNIFDQQPVLNFFIPQDSSTAEQNRHDFDNPPFSPPSPIREASQDLQETARYSPRSVEWDVAMSRTPMGLTQIFEPSQETPELQFRKSNYVSMKESQERRAQKQILDVSSDEEEITDEDFPAIRKARSAVQASSIFDRLRERNTVISDLTYCSSPGAIASQGEIDQETFVVPASAPVTKTDLQTNAQDCLSHHFDSIISDSQPILFPMATSPCVAARSLLPSDSHSSESTAYQTVLYNLPSSLPRTPSYIHADYSLISTLKAAKIRNKLSPSDRKKSTSMLDTTSSGQDAIIMQRPTLQQYPSSPVLPSVDLSGNHSIRATSVDDILLKPLRPDKPLQFTNSSILADSITTHSTMPKGDITSSSAKHKSPDFCKVISSPIVRAGTRKRGRDSQSVVETPMCQGDAKGSRKTQLALSSMQESGLCLSFGSKPDMQQRPRKRLKTFSEIRDSQMTSAMRVCTQSLKRNSSVPTQESHSLAVISKVRDIGELDLDDLLDSPASSQEPKTPATPSSSPLTSLHSSEFVDKLVLTSPLLRAKNNMSRRVLAAFRGSPEGYYPGTLLNPEILSLPYNDDALAEIRFDDSSIAQVKLVQVRPLELRIGDCIKIGKVGIRNKQVEILELKKDGNHLAYCDINGYSLIVARRKDNKSTLTCPIEQVYVPRNLMKPFFQRQFPEFTISKKATEPDMETPLTPSRRFPSGRIPAVRDLMSPTTSYKGEKVSGVFVGIGFAVTIILKSSSATLRQDLQRKIETNGGAYYEGGFEGMFTRSPYAENDEVPPLILTPDAAKLKLAVVIADSHARRAKYLQALALGLPCLHHGFIDDCLREKRIVDYRPYLLSAGEAFYPGSNVFMSMSIRLSEPTTLEALIMQRRTVLNGKTMIVVAGDTDEEHTATRLHLFLAWAMGVEDIMSCRNLDEAYHILLRKEEGKIWDLVSVQNANNDVAKRTDMVDRIVTNERIVQWLVMGKFN